MIFSEIFRYSGILGVKICGLLCWNITSPVYGKKLDDKKIELRILQIRFILQRKLKQFVISFKPKFVTNIRAMILYGTNTNEH